MKTLLHLVSAAALVTIVGAAIAQTTPQAPALGGSFLSRPVGKPGGMPPFQSPEAMQAEFVRRFEASPGFGMSRVVRPVFLAPVPALVWNDVTYAVNPPALIGLEDNPVAYIPREDSHQFFVAKTNQSRGEIHRLFAHRPMTALETNAVLALRDGHDLVVLTNQISSPDAKFARRASGPELVVVGALRARQDCATCHQCPQGTLLGAFTYTLTPSMTEIRPRAINSSSASNVLARLAPSASSRRQVASRL